MKNVSRPPERETAIVATCLQYLKLRHIFAFRVNTGALATERGGFLRFGSPGCADILACIRGRFVAFEVKTLKGRMSPAQKDFEYALVQARGTYFVIHSVDELAEALRVML